MASPQVEDGYIQLYRKTLKSRVFQNEGLFKVWIWCLLKANHKENWVPVKTGRGTTEVHLLPGQFIFGRKSAAKELKMHPSTVWKRIVKLKNMRNCDIESNTHYSLVTLINWESYQGGHKKGTSKVTPKEQPSNTNNNDNNDNNKEKNIKEKKKCVYGEFKNVLLTKDEFQKLEEKFDSVGTSDWIEQLSAYIESKGKRYKSHYATILNWDRKRGGENGKKGVYSRHAREFWEAMESQDKS